MEYLMQGAGQDFISYLDTSVTGAQIEESRATVEHLRVETPLLYHNYLFISVLPTKLTEHHSLYFLLSLALGKMLKAEKLTSECNC
jgi:hypothetical protein